MPKVIAFTANLLAETTYDFEGWELGRTVRAKSESFQVGGKGINVSKMLNRLGADNRALCFPGGVMGEACVRWLDRNQFEYIAIGDGCETRSGVVVRAEGKPETTFLGKDSLVSTQAVRSAVEILKSMDEPFVFAVCGSIQNWDDSAWDALKDWIAGRPERVSLLVDNYGPSLPWLTEQNPDMVKFNRDELELLFTDAERKQSTRELLGKVRKRYQCRRWVVTNGSEEVWIQDAEKEAICFKPPQVKCLSPTGCGDVFFATLIDCLYNKTGYDLESASRLAADYASRSAAMETIAEFDL